MTRKVAPTSHDSQPPTQPVTARIAQLMSGLGIAGLPRNYELLFEALNGNAAVARAIGSLGKAPDQAALDAIALRHALPSHNALAAGQAAGEAAQLLADISQAGEANRRERGAAVQELEEIAARLGKDPLVGLSDFAQDAGRLLSLVNSILGADRATATRVSDLQARLDVLRGGLAASREALTHDPATGLANHAALLIRLDALYRDDALAGPSALVLFRVERLEGFAETHAPGASGKTLEQLAGLFRQSVKKNDFVARTGTDLFCVLLPEVDRDIAVTIARRIAAKVAKSAFPFLDRELPAGFLTLTGGIAMSDASDTPAALYHHAAQALHVATENGTGLRLYSAEVAARQARAYRSGNTG